MSDAGAEANPSALTTTSSAALADTPMEAHPPRVGPPGEYAGGVPAVVSAMRQSLLKMGPTRTVQTLLRVNQKGGFDCPSCAWPDGDGEREMVGFCENGAKGVADEAMKAQVGPEFFKGFSVRELAAESDHWLNAQGRLAHPMVLREGATHYEAISWDDAFALIGRELGALASPDEALFYTSGRASNEAAFLYQLFVREFGTNNLPDCSNMCHESSGSALRETIGIGKGTVTLEDFDHAEIIVVIGQNPGTNHPRMLTALQRAKRNGAKICSVNPLAEAGLIRFKHPQELTGIIGDGTKLTDLHLPVAINGDMALLKGVAKALFALEKQYGGVLDREFIAGKTEGFEAYEGGIHALSWSDIETDAGVSQNEIESLATLLGGRRRIIFTWAMGLTQSPNAVGTIQEIVNLTLLLGAIGKKGAGLCPVRGHSNVQGDRTMGIWEKPPASFLDALEREFQFKAPRHDGFDVVESIHAMRDGRAKVFVALGGNFLSATPDTAVTAEALARTRLTVQVSTKLNRSHLVTGQIGLILPCLGRTEEDLQEGGAQFVSCENSMGVVQSSEGRLKPLSKHLLSEPQIVARLAHATLGEKTRTPYLSLAANYDRIRDAIEKTIPGFERYNERVREKGGFYLPNAPREGRFDTPGNRARFTLHSLPKREVPTGALVMMTIRTHDQFNTTIYGMDDRYRGIFGGRRVILMNEEDMKARGIDKGELVTLVSHFRGEERRADRFVVVPYPIPKGNSATYFPEANALVPLDSVAEISNTPTSKYVLITVHKGRNEG